MQKFGLFIFMMSLFLIGLGLIPYRKLKKQEWHPDTLILDQEGLLHYKKKGYVRWSIPLEKLSVFCYHSNFFEYGIKIYTLSGSKLFLPYFSERSCEEIKEHLLYDAPLASNDRSHSAKTSA